MKIRVQRTTHYEVRPITAEERERFSHTTGYTHVLREDGPAGLSIDWVCLSRKQIFDRLREFEEGSMPGGVYMEIEPETEGDIYRPFHWECETSGGFCEYNHATDPALDDCIHCHQPYERK